MNNQSKGKRAWVKDAAIIFLIIMLILTFFSRTIMNHSLPEVSGQYARYGTVVTSVRGTGTVQTNMAYGVQISETRTVKQVLVREGDEVEAGEVLILLEDEEGTELTNAREELANLQFNYRELLLGSKTVDTEDSLEIINLREDLDKAYAELESASAGNTEVTDAKAKVKALETEIKTLERAISEAEESASEAKSRIDSINGEKSTVSSAEKAYTNALRDIAYAEEDLEIMKNDLAARKTAQEKCDTASAELEAAQEAYDEAQEEYNEADRELSSYTNVSDKTISEARIEMTKAQEKAEEYEERYELLSKRLMNYQEAQQNYYDAKEEYELLLKDENATEEQIAEALNHRDEMFSVYQKKTKVSESEVESARNSYERYSEEAFRLEVEYDSLVNEQNEFDKDPEYVASKERFTKAEAARDKTKENLKAAQKAYDEAVDERDAIPAVSQSSINSAERELTRSKNELVYIEKDYKDAVEEFTGEQYKEDFSVEEAAKEELDTAKASLKAAEAVIEEKEAELDKKKDELEEAQDKYDDALENAPSDSEEIRRNITSMERQLKSLLETQANNRESQSIESQRFKLELEKASLAIEKQEKKVAELEEDAIDSSVTARYAGTITNVSVIAGDTANAGEDLVGIDVSGKGYTLSIPVTLEQSRYVKVGDTAKILNYWGSGITVQLAEIKNDRSNQSGRILEFDVDGDVMDGQSLNITVGERQNAYDCVVPNSAVREDANGTFIYIAEVKSTPIGNRFTARRLPVTVIVKDEISSAVDAGDGYNNEFVIVNSSSPLTDGMQIRLVES